MGGSAWRIITKRAYLHVKESLRPLGVRAEGWFNGGQAYRQMQTIPAYRPVQAAEPDPGDGARDAFDEAFKALLRAWHDYEVLKALGAPLDTVSAAHGALQKAKGEVARSRLAPMR